MPKSARITIETEDDIVTARQTGRQMAAEAGFTGTDLTLIATAISEIVRNITNYAERGEVTIAIVEKSSRRGIEIVAEDEGPGIRDIDRAMEDGYSTGRGMGLGLPGSRRIMDEFDIQSEVGSGTTVTMTKWLLRG